MSVCELSLSKIERFEVYSIKEENVERKIKAYARRFDGFFLRKNEWSCGILTFQETHLIIAEKILILNLRTRFIFNFEHTRTLKSSALLSQG